MAKKRKYDPYRAQMNRARKRGIAWLFTRQSWNAFWMKQTVTRGSMLDQYCMARKLDQGPYAPWNVEPKTNAANNAEARVTNRWKALTGAHFIL